MKYIISKEKIEDSYNYFISEISTTINNTEEITKIKFIGEEKDLKLKHQDLDKYLNLRLNNYIKKHQNVSLKDLNFKQGINIKKATFVASANLIIFEVFKMLELDIFFNDLKEKKKLNYDILNIVLFIITSHIVNFNEPVINNLKKRITTFYPINFTQNELSSAMDECMLCSEELFLHIYKKLNVLTKRDYSKLYLDCSLSMKEYEFENLEDIYSRIHRLKLIVEDHLNLLYDSNNIPIIFYLIKEKAYHKVMLDNIFSEIKKEYKNAKLIVLDNFLPHINRNITASSYFEELRYIQSQYIRNIDEQNAKIYLDDIRNWQSNNSSYKCPNQIREEYFKIVDNLKSTYDDNLISKYHNDLRKLYDVILYKRYKNNVEDKILTYSLKQELILSKDRIIDVKKDFYIFPNPLIPIIDLNYEGYQFCNTNYFEGDDKEIINSIKVMTENRYYLKLMKENFDYDIHHSTLGIGIYAHLELCIITIIIRRFILYLMHNSSYNSLKYLQEEDLIAILRNFNFVKINNNEYIQAFKKTKIMDDFMKLFQIETILEDK